MRGSSEWSLRRPWTRVEGIPSVGSGSVECPGAFYVYVNDRGNVSSERFTSIFNVSKCVKLDLLHLFFSTYRTWS